jgi:hypothetical protein
MAFFGGGYDKYRTIPKDEVKITLPETASVTFDKPNVIPLMRWEDPEGNATSPVAPHLRGEFYVIKGWVPAPFALEKHPHTLTQYLPFTATEDLSGLELRISHMILSQIDALSLDGELLRPTGATKILDDDAIVYRFDLKKGDHKLELTLNAPFTISDAIFLCGDFDADVRISDEVACVGASYYMRSYLPKKAEITLSPRRQTLALDRSFTEQGQPFYSGRVTYSLPVAIPDSVKKPTLVLLFSRAYLFRDYYVDNIEKLWRSEQLMRIPVERGERQSIFQRIFVQANAGGIFGSDIIRILQDAQLPDYKELLKTGDVNGILRKMLEECGVIQDNVLEMYH